MKVPKVKLKGHEYVILGREEYERLEGLARVAEMPGLPEQDTAGSFTAVEYARSSIARDIVRARVEAGLTQRELARLAGVRVGTLCRIEMGKHTASTASIAKIDRALQKTAKNRSARRKGG